MTNVRGLVIELVLPSPVEGDKPRALRQLVVFAGTVLERQTTNEQRRKHWRAAHYHVDAEHTALDVNDDSSWLGRWIADHQRHGYEVYGKPFLVEANGPEKVEIDSGNMPRALALRIGKARTEYGVVRDPWTGE